MKNLLFKLCTTVVLIFTLILGQLPTISNADINTASTNDKSKPLCVGYYPYYGNMSKVDVTKLTNMFVAFGYIYHNETLPTGTYYDPSKTNDESLIGTLYLDELTKYSLKKIPDLKVKNPDLKVSLSLGGYAGRGFCDATATKESRAKLVNSIVQVVNEYGLDGIDIDWECPVNGGWGTIKSCDQDKVNYTLSWSQDIRNALGEDKLVTIAAGAGYEFIYSWTEFKKIGDIVDFITIMNYDYAYGGPKYNSPLYKSSNDTRGFCTDDVIKNCLATGVPKEKIVMGAAFYGRIPTAGGVTNYIDKALLTKLGFTQGDTAYIYSDIIKYIGKNGVEERWDDEAKNPYLVYVDPQTREEHFIMQYENQKSLSIKGRYVKETGLGGIMVWETTQDVNGSLLNSINRGLYTDFVADKCPDVNNDHLIDVADLAIVASMYNTPASVNESVANCDFNNDNIIDLFDLTLLAKNISF